MCPAWLCVPLMLWMVWGTLRGSGGSQSHDTVLWSKKHSVAPLSMRASSVFRVVDKTSFIFRAFRLETTWHVTQAATTSLGVSKNLIHSAYFGKSHCACHHQALGSCEPVHRYLLHLLPILLWWLVCPLLWGFSSFWRVCLWRSDSSLGNLSSYSGLKNCPNVWLFCKDWNRTNQENYIIIYK